MARIPRSASRAWQPSTALLDGLTIAAVAVDERGAVAYANAAAVDLFGSPFDDLVGTDARVRLFDEPERGVVDEVLGLVLDSGAWTGDLAMLLGGAQIASVATSWTAVERDGRPAGALVLVEPPRDEGSEGASSRPLGRRLGRLARVTSELLAAETVDEVSDIVTDHMMNAAGASVATMALMVDDQTLALVAIRGGKPGVAGRWATIPLAANTPATESVRTGRPILVRDEEIAARYPDLESAAPGSRAILCLPLVVAGGRVLGAVSLSFPGRRVLSDPERVFLRLIADTCALTIDRIEAQRAAADREAKLRFLADVSGRLLGDLDYESTLASVAHAAIPWFADWCTIELAEDGRLRTITVANAHPEHAELVRELQADYGPEPGEGSYLVWESGETLLVPEVTDELLAAGARDARHLELLQGLGLRSGLSCALKVGDRTFGVISWVAGHDGRRFDEADAAFGEDLAQRAALALDNAHLHSQVRSAAMELQRAVLPEVLPGVPGWTTAVEYLPAGRTDAGGDFYDVLALEDGRVAMFVGDVMGRGVAAASVMAQMRSAIRTLIAVDPAPVAVLAGMDRVFDALHLEQLVTMVYVIVDPALDHLQVINAGHPPPVLMARDGQIEVLDHPSTLILGVGGGHRAVRSAEFRPGDALLLYTDGLVERRGEDADDSLSRLIASLSGPRNGTPEEWLGDVVEELRDQTRDDDVAAMLVARDPS